MKKEIKKQRIKRGENGKNGEQERKETIENEKK